MLTLRRRGISDQAVLRAMDEVPREHFVEARFADSRLCRPGAADRLRPDHQPALRGRLHDRAARGASRIIACSRSAPARATRRRCCRGWPARWSRSSATARSPTARARRLKTLGYDNVEVLLGDGLRASRSARPTTASSSPRRPKAFRRRWSTQLAEDGVMMLPLGPHGGAAGAGQADQDRGRACSARRCSPVRFVPLLPGQAREL